MKLNTQSPLHVLLFCLILIFQFSCSKDSDLMTDYVLADAKEDLVIGKFVVDDTFETTIDSPIVLDVLANDTFENEEEVIIAETSAPENGTAEINADNTITYTPETPAPAAETVDTFTYTTEVVTPDETVVTETATVTVIVTENSSRDFSGVNFSAYGAVGDGATDDTAALQAALDAEANLLADANAVFKISKVLNLDQSFAHNINWNGATIITNSALLVMIDVDKRTSNGGSTAMQDLTIDGNETASRAVAIYSRVNFNNVDITGMRQPTSQSPAGFYINFYNDSDAHGDWIFDGCDVDNIIAASNGDTRDSWGAANGYLIYWRYRPTVTTTLKVSNAIVHGMWGEDAQCIATFSVNLDITNSPGSMEFTNLNLYDWERRCVKGFAGNQTWTDCTFTDPSPSDPNLYSSNKSGMFVIGAGSLATDGSNSVIEGCTFVSKGYDGRVIVAGDSAPVTDISFNNCTWSGGSDLLFYKRVGDVDIRSGIFGSGSITNDYGTPIVDGGELRFDTDNTYVEGNFFSSLNVLSYIETDLDGN